MSVLEGLQPEKVFYYFEQISRIPHGSGNVDQISDYLLQFARERSLLCIQDEMKNIIIVKEAAPGYEQEEPFILQGHMDMVAVKEPGCEADMTKDPLRLKVENGRICAEGTSLGGDDGIAVAYCLALLDSEDIGHPRLEIVLTVNEETGMHGAMDIDLSMLQGKRMINLDQEEEGIFITSCAGGARVDVTIPVCRISGTKDMEENRQMEVKITGLSGGHSGTEIYKNGGNANVLLGQLVGEVIRQTGAGVMAMEGGVADNAIPREASARLLVPEENIAQVQALVEKQEHSYKEQFAKSDPALRITCHLVQMPQDAGEGDDKEESIPPYACCTGDSIRNALSCLAALPNGVTGMSRHVPGLVETSLNLGIMKLTEDALTLSYAVRSSVNQEKESLCGRMLDSAGGHGAVMTVRNAYPGWAYRVDSPLRDKMCAIYEQMYGRAPKLEAIHAGLECGILADKIEGLDCISIGPDLHDVHTAQESMDIASVRRVWEYLVAVLSQR